MTEKQTKTIKFCFCVLVFMCIQLLIDYYFIKKKIKR